MASDEEITAALQRTRKILEFKEDLRALINKHSRENESGSPDFLLAQYLSSTLGMLETFIHEREKWYGRPMDRFGMPQTTVTFSHSEPYDDGIGEMTMNSEAGQLNSDERAELEALRRATHGMKVNTPIDAIMDEMRLKTEQFTLTVTFGPFSTREQAAHARTLLQEDHRIYDSKLGAQWALWELFIAGEIKAVEK